MKRKILYLLLICLCLLYAMPTAAQTARKYHLPKDVMNRKVFMTGNWIYHSGDNPDWATPKLDDTSWEAVGTWLPSDQLSAANWQGVGWFRLHLTIDPALLGKALGLVLNYNGHYQVYLDGKLIYRLSDSGGQRPEDMGRRTGPVPISFHDKPDHVIALRYKFRCCPLEVRKNRITLFICI